MVGLPEIVDFRKSLKTSERFFGALRVYPLVRRVNGYLNWESYQSKNLSGQQQNDFDYLGIDPSPCWL